ncbi:hypothetical protein, partial [uncultured Muribaculum sp.]|uniref:hypothetical protein n=1 Tax=uncultured Muribaculum sp. TaxID=1918613 RepID=UPI00272CB2A9
VLQQVTKKRLRHFDTASFILCLIAQNTPYRRMARSFSAVNAPVVGDGWGLYFVLWGRCCNFTKNCDARYEGD